MPGVTAGVAATAYAGIPVTHRDDASAVAFVTGHEDPEKAETALDWEALAALPRHARLLHGRQAAGRERGGADRGRSRPRRARGGDRARHDGRASAPSSRPWGRSPTRSSARAIGAPALIVVGPVVGAARGARLARAAAAARPPRRRHPRPRPGERPRRDACASSAPRWSSCRRSGSSRGSRARRCGARSKQIGEYALICLTSPNGARSAVRGAGRRGPRCPGAGGNRQKQVGEAGRRRRRRGTDGRRDRPGNRPGPRRARDQRRRRARALRRRGAGRGAGRGRGRGPARACRPRRRGARRAPRRAARARRRGRRRRPLRDRAREADAGGGSKPPRAPTTSPSPPPRPCAT